MNWTAAGDRPGGSGSVPAQAPRRVLRGRRPGRSAGPCVLQRKSAENRPPSASRIATGRPMEVVPLGRHLADQDHQPSPLLDGVEIRAWRACAEVLSRSMRSTGCVRRESAGVPRRARCRRLADAGRACRVRAVHRRPLAAVASGGSATRRPGARHPRRSAGVG